MGLDASNHIQKTKGSVFQIGKGAKVLAKGNIFKNAATPFQFDIPSNPLWSSSNRIAGCTSILGHNCQANNLTTSKSFAKTNTDILTITKSLANSLAAITDVSTTKANILKNTDIRKI
ncbi:hypothetical protein BOTNAR_4160g00010 [Botryotinia narcissicola]|uniref:Pectate lyase domain-containing protein n=1 Tax=Botryotinia narcissicola TaxID=278944 RepID=A0A4Z1GRN1_9HELO|nr:hypothetical protein BOTNAR_4160g00010 [Botryotinia narcissicola]